MSNTESKNQIAELFKKTGSDHHQAFIETDGEDPEWPLWYAEYLVDKLGPLLTTKFTKSELVYLILTVEKERAENAPSSDWPVYYADFFIQKQT